MYCVKCGKEIRDGSSFCSECGAAQPNDTSPEKEDNRTYPYEQQPKLKTSYDILCIIGVVVSGISLFVHLIGIAGFILSLIGYKNVKKTREKGRELAIAGMVVGIIMTIYCVVNLLLAFFAFGHLADLYNSILPDL